MKKALSLLLVAVLLLSVICCAPFSVAAAEAPSAKTGDLPFATSGTTGNCSWSYDISTYTLTIRGNGRTGDYSLYNKAPWSPINNVYYRSYIYTVVVEEGVTNLGYYLFYDCDYLREIYLPDSVTSASDYWYPNNPTQLNSRLGEDYGNIFGTDNSYAETLANNTPFLSIRFVPIRGTTGDCQWRLNGSVLTISGEGAMANYSTNEYVDPHAPWPKRFSEVVIEDGVTNVGAGAFLGYSRLSKVTVPNSVTTIGGAAFYDCSALNNITLGDSVKAIGFGAFQHCTSLSSIILPESVTLINNNAFYGCTSLVSVYVLSANCRYDNYYTTPDHFYNCNANLTLYSHPSSTTKTYANQNNINFVGELPYGTTGECKWAREGRKLTITGNGRMGDYGYGNGSPWGTFINEVVIGDGVTYVGSYSFYQCTYLNTVSLPDTVTEIGHDAFAYCGFSELPLPAHLEKIGSQAFARCINYHGFEFPDSLTEIGSGAFVGNRLLDNITIPPDLETLEGSVFAECTNLSSINIPSNITSVEGSTFYGCTGLTTITVDPENPVYDSRNNCNAIIETSTGALIRGCKTTVIPEGVTSIDQLAFYDAGGADRIVVPGTVKSIGSYAFCRAGFTNIVLCDGVESFSYYTFQLSSALTHIYIPASVASINYNPFMDSPNVTIYGEKGSAAEAFANEENIPFVLGGDANLDNRVSIKDVTAVQRQLAEIEDVSDDFAADTTFDDSLTIDDATWVQQKLAEFF